ncbi:MAG: hypothetical protein ACRD30_08705, partial [Bryobacteraceae bacterium]
GVIWTGLYDHSVTGNAFELPQMLYDGQLASYPQFWILPPPAAHTYSNARIAALIGPKGYFASQYRPHSVLVELCVEPAIAFMQLAYLNGPITLALLFLPLAWRDPRAGPLMMTLGLLLAALSIEAWHHEHYAAPGAGALAILVALSLGRMWRMRIDTFPIGRGLVIGLMLFAAGRGMVHLKTAFSRLAPGADRVELIHKLEALGKPQLIFVHYPSPGWSILRDWVYNGADIDRQRVVFANDLGPKEDARLLAYYPDRQAWIVSMQDSGYRLDSYPR